MEMLYDNIFEAIRSFAPSSPLLQLNDDYGMLFRRTNKYEIIDMGDHIAAFPGFPFRLFRGEYRKYNSCKASIFRNNDPDDKIIDELKIIEFKNILLTFPQVQYAIEDHMKVDFLALAQHYELNTNLIDVTSEPEIAAYFATHRWVKKVAVPVETGIGCIRCFTSPTLTATEIDPKFHMIGLQCFQRPGIQAAYGFEMEAEEDLADRGWCVYFKQNADASRLIHTNFHVNQDKVNKLRANGIYRKIEPNEIEDTDSWLFPKEEIADIAKTVKASKRISKAAVEEYGRSFEDALRRKGIKIVERPVYSLSEEHRRELEEQYRGHPYGDVQLMAIPVLRK